jgi:hypothetical protein
MRCHAFYAPLGSVRPVIATPDTPAFIRWLSPSSFLHQMSKKESRPRALVAGPQSLKVGHFASPHARALRLRRAYRFFSLPPRKHPSIPLFPRTRSLLRAPVGAPAHRAFNKVRGVVYTCREEGRKTSCARFTPDPSLACRPRSTPRARRGGTSWPLSGPRHPGRRYLLPLNSCRRIMAATTSRPPQGGSPDPPPPMSITFF